jgi:hypothetical protein
MCVLSMNIHAQSPPTEPIQLESVKAYRLDNLISRNNAPLIGEKGQATLRPGVTFPKAGISTVKKQSKE